MHRTSTDRPAFCFFFLAAMIPSFMAIAASDVTAATSANEELIPLTTDQESGKVWLDLPAPSGDSDLLGEYILAVGLRSGIGANAIGMDRGLLGSGKLVRFRHVGGRILLEQVNLGYRSSSDNALERRAVAESFSTSVLWSGAVESRTAAGRLRVDFTSFLLRDANGIARTLESMVGPHTREHGGGRVQGRPGSKCGRSARLQVVSGKPDP